MTAQQEREAAPPTSLPDWSECAMRVDNSEFFKKSVAEGGHGPESDAKLATELHRFIYEYDDADSYRSAWFLHRLELLLNETREQARASLSLPSSGDGRDAEGYKRGAAMLGHAMHVNILAMQAAYIEWMQGRGATEAMQWIANTLEGPGLIPDDTETDAQAYFDREMKAEDERLAAMSQGSQP